MHDGLDNGGGFSGRKAETGLWLEGSYSTLPEASPPVLRLLTGCRNFFRSADNFSYLNGNNRHACR
jgi:hypothetical protein